MSDEILWCPNHGASIVPQTSRCGVWFSLPGPSKRRKVEVCPMVRRLLVDPDAPSIDFAYPFQWMNEGDTVESVPRQPAGRYVRIDGDRP